MEKPPFWSQFTHDKGHFTLLQAYALQKGGVVFKEGSSKNHIRPHGGRGVEKPKKFDYVV